MDMTRSLLYVSRSLLQPGTAAIELDRIVVTSRLRNQRLCITGVLIGTDVGFAQILEGEAASIDDIFKSICRDTRHRDVTVLWDKRARRRFEQWSMAYTGPSSYVLGHVEPLLGNRSENPVDSDVRRLTKLMHEFGQPSKHV
jgi:hypothetical protein